MQKRRVYAPQRGMEPGLYVVWVFLRGGREYVWKGRAANDDVAEKLALKRMGKTVPFMWMTSRIRG